MRRVHFDPFTPVIMTWEDAYGEGSGCYSTIQEALNWHKPVIRNTVGYFVGYTTHEDGLSVLVLASDDDRTPTTPEAVGAVKVTPIALIRSLVAVEGQKSKRKKR